MKNLRALGVCANTPFNAAANRTCLVSRVTGNLEWWRFLKLPVASFGYNFRIAEKPSMGSPSWDRERH
jgi:hypothetical protein